MDILFFKILEVPGRVACRRCGRRDPERLVLPCGRLGGLRPWQERLKQKIQRPMLLERENSAEARTRCRGEVKRQRSRNPNFFGAFGYVMHAFKSHVELQGELREPFGNVRK